MLALEVSESFDGGVDGVAGGQGVDGGDDGVAGGPRGGDCYTVDGGVGQRRRRRRCWRWRSATESTVMLIQKLT